MTAVAARARGLETTVLAAPVLAELERARDGRELAELLARAGLPGLAGAPAIERAVRARAGHDLVTLARWSHAIAPLALDEDRRSLRALVRGLASGISSERRLAGTVPTALLPARALAELAEAPTVEELAALLADHPLAPALAAATKPVDLLALELALTRRFGELASTRDRALRTYLAQVIDTEHAIAALLLADRGHELDARAEYARGGRLVDRATFVAAAAGPSGAARARLASALAGTPLARALFAAIPGALEDAALAWQLATQTRLRRMAPLGLAPVI
ncbi:MAG: V-type ATPase subunit, partial [Acidobacteriota bacterium]